MDTVYENIIKWVLALDDLEMKRELVGIIEMSVLMREDSIAYQMIQQFNKDDIGFYTPPNGSNGYMTDSDEEDDVSDIED